MSASAVAQDIVAGPFVRGPHAYYLTRPCCWTDAEAIAVANGGHLITIEDAAEDQWAAQTFAPFISNSRGPWIGLQRGSGPDGWSWVSGSTSSYRNWDDGQPDNARGIIGCSPEPYAHQHRIGGAPWNDFNCDFLQGCPQGRHPPFPGIIEVPCNTANPPVRTWTNAVGGDWDDNDNWNPTGAPLENAVAVFSIPNGMYAVTLPGSRRIAGIEIHEGSVTFAFGDYGLLPPTLLCNSAVGSLVTSPGFSSVSTLTLLSGSLDLYTPVRIASGNESTSTLDIVGEAVFHARNALLLGAGHSAQGTLSIGNNSRVEATRLYAGYTSGDIGSPATRGTINLENGGRLEVSELILGYQPRTDGRLNLSGGTMQVDTLVISDQGASTFDWTGGNIEGLRSLAIGRGDGSDGQLNLSGTARSLALSGTGGTARISVGEYGRGTLRVENGADISLSAGQLQAMEIGTRSSGRGLVVVDGAASSILGSSTPSSDTSMLLIGNSAGPEGTLIVDNGATVAFGHIRCDSNITGPGGGIVVRNQSHLISNGLGDAYSTPSTGLRVGNSAQTANMLVQSGSTVNAHTAIFTGSNGSNAVVTVEDANSSLNVDGTLYLASVGTQQGGQLKVRSGGKLNTRDTFIGTGIGGVSTSGTVTLEGPGLMWSSSGTINVGDPLDANAVGTLNLVNGARVHTDRLLPGATAHITGGATGNPLIQVGRSRAAAELTCDTLLMSPETNLGALNLTFGIGGGIGGTGTWPGDFSASGGAQIVATQSPPTPWIEDGYLSQFTIAGSLMMDSTSTVEAACGLVGCSGGEYIAQASSRLTVQGVASIDGTLKIEPWMTVLPGWCESYSHRREAIGRTYAVLTASSVVGAFDQLQLSPNLVTNRAHLDYEPGRVLVTIDEPVCNTAITTQPLSAQTSPGATTSLSVGAATEFGTLEYHWEWTPYEGNWQPMHFDYFYNGILARSINNQGTIEVTIDPQHASLPGLSNTPHFRCNIHNPSCGEWVQSGEAVLTICNADFNRDTVVDFFDYLDFVDEFAAGNISADFNHDTVVDFFDYLDFVDALSGGC